MKQERFEHMHIECAQDTTVVNTVLQMYGLFHWEPTQTQTIVSKESHLESTSSVFFPQIINPRDSITSVSTEERFVAIDFRRNKNIPKLKQIKSIEEEYFQIVYQLDKLGCSIIDNYESPPPRVIGWGTLINLCNPFFFFFHPIKWISLNFRSSKDISDHLLGYRKKKLEQHRDLKTKLDQLVDINTKILNV